MLIAQITDTHVRRKGDLLHHMIRTGRELRRAVAAIAALRPLPAFVVATGDLVDRGKTKEYKRLRSILAGLPVPCYLVPGNHDDRDGLREAFPEHAYLPKRGPLCYVVETRPVRLVVLDTTRKGREPGGEVDDARATWLDAALSAAPATPTLVAMHHPPFAIGIPPVDAHGFRNRDALELVIAAHPQVAGIVCGHIHRFAEARFGGTVARSAPSTAHQLIIDRTAEGYGVRLERPAFVLHRWDGRELAAEVVATDVPPRALRAVS